MYLWTSSDIEKVLIQLDNKKLPFEKYSFTKKENGLHILGRGGFSLVFEGESRYNHNRKFAIKVMGFDDKHIHSELFISTAKAQKDLCLGEKNVVKIYDYEEIFVKLDDENNVISTEKVKKGETKKDCLKLQFIVMEKLNPVLIHENNGRMRLCTNELALCNEKEIIKLAYDIGRIISKSHKDKILHRDIKLENIFYDPVKKSYKLGDFGIAKVTEDGMASTVAFTKGYGAPEVVGSYYDRYDNTADIYSFGMLIYLLLNKLRFPGSDNYQVNIKEQYRKEYELPRPENGSEELYQIIRKMCMFNPDDRYQSMDSVLDDLEGLVYSKAVGYKKQHKLAPLTIGTIFLFAGVVIWQLAFMPDWSIDMSVAQYVLLGAAILKTVLYVTRRDTMWASFLIMSSGICIMVTSGFSWAIFVYVVLLCICSGIVSCHFAGIMIVLYIVPIICNSTNQNIDFEKYGWLAVALLPMAFFLILQYYISMQRDEFIIKLYYKMHTYWMLVIMIYVIFILYGLTLKGMPKRFYCLIFGENIVNRVAEIGIVKAGIAGIIFCIVWIAREKYLSKFQV